MVRRDWNELPAHCLVEVFGRVGIESLVETIPLVSKTWHEATFYPHCWQQLVFTKSPFLKSRKPSIPTPKLEVKLFSDSDLAPPHFDTDEANDYLEQFVSFAIGRSHRLVTEVVFQPNSHLKEGQITSIAERCPSLKHLVLPNQLSYVINFEIANSIYNWKSLEALRVTSLIGLKPIIANISKYCKNFRHLSVNVHRLDGDVASVIATQLPDIKTLDLQFSTIERKDLVTILKGCRNLEHLDVSEYTGVVGDDEILKLVSHIHTFKHKGSQ